MSLSYFSANAYPIFLEISPLNSKCASVSSSSYTNALEIRSSSHVIVFSATGGAPSLLPKILFPGAVSYTHLTLPTTPYV